MPAVAADTHTAIWYLITPEMLSPNALRALNASDPVFVSSISVVETTYLVEKGRLIEEVYRRLVRALSDPAMSLVIAPLDLDVAEVTRQIPRHAVPDMPDRIIAATALHLNVPLVTRDHKIRATSLTTIW